MEISVIVADKETERRLTYVLAQVALEAGEEETSETSRRVLPRIDIIE